MTAPASPTINTGVIGADLNWDIDFTDNFDIADGPLEGRTTTFKFINMDDTDGGLHKVGNSDLNADGTANPGGSVQGKRWSAWYDQFHDQTTYIANEELVMGGHAVNTPDPTRVQYVDNGTTVNFDQWKFYASFLSTWDRDYSNAANGGAGGHIEAADSPGIIFEPGSCIQFRASFEEMRARSFRWSAYLLPVQYDEVNLAYNNDAADGAEVDWPEFDATPTFLGHLQQKVIAGAAGQTPNGSVDILSGFGINPSVGYHVYTLVWLTTGLYWLVDGVETQREESLVMQSPHYLVWSKELNSGTSDTDAHYNPPYVPQDNGIFGQNFWLDRDLVINPVGDGEVARISYLRSWKLGAAIAGKIRRSPVGTIKQRLFFSWEADDENFDYDAHDYLWVNVDIPVSAGPVLKNATTREMILEFTGTITGDIVAHIDCQVTKK